MVLTLQNYLATSVAFNSATAAAVSQVSGITDPFTGALYEATETVLDTGIVLLVQEGLNRYLPGITKEDAMLIGLVAGNVLGKCVSVLGAWKFTQLLRNTQLTASQAQTLTNITNSANFVLSRTLLRNISVSQIPLPDFTHIMIPSQSMRLFFGEWTRNVPSWVSFCATYCDKLYCRKICA